MSEFCDLIVQTPGVDFHRVETPGGVFMVPLHGYRPCNNHAAETLGVLSFCRQHYRMLLDEISRTVSGGSAFAMNDNLADPHELVELVRDADLLRVQRHEARKKKTLAAATDHVTARLRLIKQGELR